MTAVCCAPVSSETIDHCHASRAGITMQDACNVNQGLATCSQKMPAQKNMRKTLRMKFSDKTCSNAIKGAPLQDK